MADDSSNNPYIRTYAKDVAALSGKMPSAAVAKTGVPLPPPTSQVGKEPDSDRDAVLARLRERAAQDPVHEGNFLPSSLPTPFPNVAPIGTTHPPLPDPSPQPIPDTKVNVVIPPPLPRTGSNSFRFPPLPVVPPPPPPVVVVAPVPPPLVPPPVLHPAMPASLAPVPPTTIPPPIPPPSTPTFIPPPEIQKPVSLDTVSPIHTYKSDFSDRIDSKQASAFSVLAAQSDAGQLPAAPVPTTKGPSRKLVMTVVGVVLILVGVGGAYATFVYVKSHASVALGPTIPSLVFADDKQAVTGEGPQLLQALASSASAPLPDGQVRVVYLTQASTTPDGKTVYIPLSGGRLIGALQLSAPDILLRNIAPESTVGIVHAGDETRAFFIMRVLSYERTFAGMLQWESSIENDLDSLYPQYPAPVVAPPTIATTTKVVNGKTVVITTTVPAAPVSTQAPRFVDEITANHDVRALKDGSGRTILLYGYVDKATLVIARNEQAFGELLNRLSSTKQQ